MRIIHTSDWHIGRKFNEQSLLEYQSQFGAWLVDLVASESIDAVLISGDVFDRSNPGADAVSVAGEILVRVAEAGAQIVMISGNHDSADRLGFVSALTAKGGLHIVTERRDLSEIDGIARLSTSDGEEVEVLAVPYLEPSRIAASALGAGTHQGVIERYLELNTSKLSDPSRSIVMAHAFVQGGSVQTSESERTLSVGGTDRVDPAIFDGFGYVALGHLHRPQQVNREDVVYSGSPLAYSFSEDHPKAVRLITTDNGALSHVEIPVGVGRPVRTIQDSMENLLASSKYAAAEESWIRAILTDDTLQVGAMDRLRDRFPHILLVNQSAAVTPQGAVVVTDETGRQRSVGEIVGDYVSETFGDEIDAEVFSFINASIGEVLAREDIGA